ncbi:MAG: mannosyltransferase family protein [Prochlorococcaceae cyanobacterium]
MRFILGCWALSRLLLLGPIVLVAGHHGLQPFPQLLFSWDTVHYLKIAREGASGTELAFFPLFPWLLSVISDRSVPQMLLAGLAVANVAFLLTLLVLHRQASQLWGLPAARWTVLISCFNPFGIFCSIPYTESLYLLLTSCSLWLSQARPRSRWPLLAAGTLGALSAATRPTGIVLAPALLIAGLDRKRPWQGVLSAGLTSLGLLAVMGLCWQASGNLLGFVAAQRGWGLTPGFNLSGLHSWERLLSQILAGPTNTAHGGLVNPWYPLAMALLIAIGAMAVYQRSRRPSLSFALGAFALTSGWALGGSPALSGAMIVASVGLLIWGWRALPAPYRIFGILSLISYLLIQSTISMERHLYATVPVLLLGGLWCSRHPRWSRWLLAFGCLLAVTFSLRLSRGEWVG